MLFLEQSNLGVSKKKKKKSLPTDPIFIWHAIGNTGIFWPKPGYSGLHPNISQRLNDKIYEDLPATLYPDVSVSNRGIHLECIVIQEYQCIVIQEYRSVTKYMKTCQLNVPRCISQ